MIKFLRERGDMAIILVEQFFDFAFELGDEFVVLKRGEVILKSDKGATQRSTLLDAVTI